MVSAVFDTVVFVRALLNPHGLWGRLALSPPVSYNLYLSTPLVIEILQVLARDELVSKIERRHGAYLPAVAGLLACFHRAISVDLADIPAVSRDPKDDKILATALAARADHLVSEDQDLLVLGTYDGIQIVNAAAFLDALQRTTG